MSGAAMSLKAATSGLLVFLLSVQVIQGQNGWGVTYTSTEICALKGSTVEIHCSYTYPSGVNTTVERTLWFTKLQDKEPMDLRADSKYAGRVQYHCANNYCTLIITDLRESDSAVYKFRFTTNQPGGKYVGSTGVTLSVTGFQVQSNIESSCNFQSCKYATLTCHSTCHHLPHHPSYIWYKNGEKTEEQQEPYYHHFYPEDSYSCALKGHEDVHSPLVCVHGQSCNKVMYTDRSICAFKGSSVDISCTYNSVKSITSQFWFSSNTKYNTRPKDISQDHLYDGRVDVNTRGGHSTLRITNLRESDSAEYRFKFTAPSFEWGSSLPGTTLTVTDADLQVQVIWSPAGPKLICHSSCLLPGRSKFIWYKNETKIWGETSVSYGGYVDLADNYSCAYQSYHSPPVYAPKVPTLLKNSSGDIMKDDLVTLTCSSDANPAAKYTWYKKNQTPLSEEPQLFFSSIQSSDSGEYYCAVENELGRRTSEYVTINVQYAPQLPSVSVSPSAEIVEGSSVTLTCSSDVNPAANYTWYKENQTLLEGQKEIYHFTSIRSEDSGSYHCMSENQHGRINSTSLVLDVQYAPKPPSVSVSPSAEIVEGSSVTLTCSSDANPAAKYTWYKEDEDSPKSSGQIFTITDFTAEHSGNYYCEAQNTRGRHNSTLQLTVVTGAWKLAAAGTVSCVLLAILAVLAVFLWIRRKKSLTQEFHGGERPDNGPQLNMGPVYDAPSAVAQSQPAEGEDELHYSSISFPQNQEEALYSNVRPAQPHRQREEADDDDDVEYTAIKTESASGASGTRRQKDGEDLFALYSTVKK